MTMQPMSLLDLNMHVADHGFGSFIHGMHETRSLLAYPLAAWTPEVRGSASLPPIPQSFTNVFESNLRTNPHLKFYKALFEMPEDAANIPVVRASFVEDVVRDARDRGPLTDVESNIMPYVLSTMILPSPYLPANSPQSFAVGHLHFRPSSAWARDHQQRTSLLEVNAGLLSLASDEPLACPTMTLQLALFPHLFPHGRGAFNGKIAFQIYLMTVPISYSPS